MATVEVIVPWAGAEPHRLAARGWVLDRYAACHPDWMLTLASDRPGGSGRLGVPWVKARAVNPAVAASAADVVVVNDADCWCPGVDEAVATVVSGRYQWAVPHIRTHRFTPEFTARVVDAADPDQHTSASLVERPQLNQHPGGGVVVVRRTVAADTPMDPRFSGWGGEDVAWGWALRTLHGKPWHGAWPLYHLWHPPQDRPGRLTLPPANEALCRRYKAANRKPRVMRALVDEAVAIHVGAKAPV